VTGLLGDVLGLRQKDGRATNFVRAEAWGHFRILVCGYASASQGREDVAKYGRLRSALTLFHQHNSAWAKSNAWRAGVGPVLRDYIVSERR